MSASAATTLLLATGFAFAALAASPGSSASFGGLLMGYLIGGAVGTAVPTPAGIGTTEAALVGILLLAHIPSAVAISTVLTFRLITFWAPAVLGVATGAAAGAAGVAPLEHAARVTENSAASVARPIAVIE